MCGGVHVWVEVYMCGCVGKDVLVWVEVYIVGVCVGVCAWMWKYESVHVWGRFTYMHAWKYMCVVVVAHNTTCSSGSLVLRLTIDN